MADNTLAYLMIALIIAVFTGAIFLLQYIFNKGNEEDNTGQESEAAAVPRVNRAVGNRNNARARLRARLAERNDDPEDDAPPLREDVPLLEESGEEDEDGNPLPQGKIGKKKAAKLQLKAEKKLMRERELKEREEKKELEEKKREEEKKKEEEEEAEELKRQEEERKLLEEKEQREQEEYEKLKTAFVVEDSGYDQNNDEEKERDLLKEFVEFIKQEKVVVLEELAARFRLRTQSVINRINDLLADETLSGVMDDRGKFIYISKTELESIAKFITQRGRVSLSELVQESGTLVSLSSAA